MGPDQIIRLAEAPPFRLGALQVVPATRQVIRGRTASTLQPRVMQVLVALHDASGLVVSREALIERCWEGRVVGEDAIQRVIALLRELGEESGAFRVETVVKVGYRLVETGVTDEQLLEAAGAPALRRLSPRLWIVLPVFAIALAVVGWKLAPPPQTGRVEVAPFTARAAEPQLQQLASAAGDETIAALAHAGIETAKAGAAASPSEFIVSGALDRQGDTLSALIHIQDRRSGRTLSSVQISRPAGAGIGFAQQIGGGVAAGLNCMIADRRQSRRRLSPEVLSLYLNMCDAVAREANPQRMLEGGRQLVQAAPDLAIGQALFAIAQANAANALEYMPAEADALRRGARQSAQTALKLDPNTPKAYVAIGNSYVGQAHWAEREAAYQKAHAMDPNLTPGRMSYIDLLTSVGRNAAAQSVAQQVVAIGDPRTSNYARFAVIEAYAAHGDLAAAERAFDEAASFSPSRAAVLSWLLASQWEDRDAALARLAKVDPSVAGGPRAVICARTFLEALPRRQAAHAKGLPTACDGQPPNWKAQMLAREGDVDGAIDEARRALAAAPADPSFLFYPSMRPVRADPRFADLLAPTGLTDYWRQTGQWPDFCGEPGAALDCRTVLRGRQENFLPKIRHN